MAHGLLLGCLPDLILFLRRLFYDILTTLSPPAAFDMRKVIQ